MDAITFIKERKRLCKMYVCCSECPASNNDNECRFSVASEEEASNQIELLEKWSAAHQPKIRQSIFLSHYPKAEIDDAGFLKVCPLVVEGSDYKDSCKCGYVTCERCSKNYWSIVVEEESK